MSVATAIETAFEQLRKNSDRVIRVECDDFVVHVNERSRDVKPEPQAAAIPEGYEVQIDSDGSVHVICHGSKTAVQVECSLLIRYFTDLLSAAPKPEGE